MLHESHKESYRNLHEDQCMFCSVCFGVIRICTLLACVAVLGSLLRSSRHPAGRRTVLLQGHSRWPHGRRWGWCISSPPRGTKPRRSASGRRWGGDRHGQGSGGSPEWPGRRSGPLPTGRDASAGPSNPKTCDSSQMQQPRASLGLGLAAATGVLRLPLNSSRLGAH